MTTPILQRAEKAVIRIADFLIYSNLFIACCAGSFMWATYHMIGLYGQWDSLVLLTSSSTLALYLALRLHASRRLRGIEFTERILWVDRNSKISWTLFIISVAGTGVALWMSSRAVWIALIPAGILSLGYGLPFLPLPLKYKLRHRNYLKIFLIAGVWAWMAVLLPVVHTGAAVSDPSVWLLFLSRFLFVLGITIPFDIRDIEVDKVYKLETIPSALGVRSSIHLAWACILISFLLLLPVYLILNPAIWHVQSVLVPLLPVYVITAFFIGMSARTKNDYLYLVLLDGTMLLQGIALELASRL